MRFFALAFLVLCASMAMAATVGGDSSEDSLDAAHASDPSPAGVTLAPGARGDPDLLARTPKRWGTADFDLTEYFSEEEMAEWRAFATRRRVLTLLALFLSLFAYAAFAFTPAGRGASRNGGGPASEALDRSPRQRLYSAASTLAGLLSRLAPFKSAPARQISKGLTALFGADWAPAMIFTWLFLLVVALAVLPLQLVAEQQARAAGLSVYTNWAWLWDLVKGLLFTALSLTFVVFGLFGLVRRMPRRWWIALGAPAALLLVGWGFVSQYQSRAFYEFSPLEDQELRSRFEALAAKKGITLSAVEVIDASRHTRGINAYVAGLGPTRELVFFDTAIDLLAPTELEAVLAHELGHVDRERPVLRYALSGVALLALLWLISRVLLAAAPRHRFDGPGDPLALPLVLLVVALAFLAVRPIERAMSRHEERLADRAGLSLTGDPESFISLQVALARHNRADVAPPAWAIFWFGTHPPIAERIATARWYREWLVERN